MTEELKEKLLDIEAKLIALQNDYAQLKHDVREPQSSAEEIIHYLNMQASLEKRKIENN